MLRKLNKEQYVWVVIKFNWKSWYGPKQVPPTNERVSDPHSYEHYLRSSEN